FAAQAAAGMANPAFSAVVTITVSLGRPAAAVWKRSTWRASANGVAPLSRRVLYPPGLATRPTPITCTPSAGLLPVGSRALSALALAAGRPPGGAAAGGPAAARRRQARAQQRGDEQREDEAVARHRSADDTAGRRVPAPAERRSSALGAAPPPAARLAPN